MRNFGRDVEKYEGEQMSEWAIVGLPLTETHAHTYSNTNTNTHSHKQTHTHTHRPTHTDIFKQTNTNTDSHTDTHTHIQTDKYKAFDETEVCRNKLRNYHCTYDLE